MQCDWVGAAQWAVGVVGWVALAYIFYSFIRGSKMIEVNELLGEVASELREEETKAAKAALKNIERDIMNAKKVIANLERKKADLIVAIGEGSF